MLSLVYPDQFVHLLIIFPLVMFNSSQTSPIIDRYFYESYKKVQEKKSKSLSFYIVRIISLLLVLPINHIILQQHKDNRFSLFSIFLATTLLYTLLQTFFAAYFYCAYVRSKNKIIKIAIEFHHVYLGNGIKNGYSQQGQSNMGFYEKQEILDLKVSSAYYDYQNLQKIADVSEEFKSMRESNGLSMIANSLESSMLCFKLLNWTFMLSSLLVFSFGITVSTMLSLNQVQHSLLQMVLISQVMFQPRVYAILLLILAAPVGIVVGCIYCCLCGGQKVQAKLPDSIKATPECISKCAECSICFQGINVDEEVVVLPCSDMHVFHFSCIEGWTKVKPNCPNCRHLLI